MSVPDEGLFSRSTLMSIISSIHINMNDRNVTPSNGEKPSLIIQYSNMTSFFRFVNKRASYPFGIISLTHAPVNVTDFSIGSINSVRHFPQT